MSVTRSDHALTNALVHPSVLGSPLERARHGWFVVQQLGVTAATLAFAPFFLVTHGAPTPGESSLFALGLLPLGAAMLVARTGRIVAGHAVVVATLLATALTFALGTGTSIGAALAWVILAQIEAVLSLDRKLAMVAMLATVCAIPLALLTAGHGNDHPALSGDAIVAAAAIFALASLARSFAIAAATTAALSGETRRAAAVTATQGEAVVIFDAAGSVHEISPECETRLGLPASELLGRGLFEHVHVTDRPAFLKAIADAARAEETITVTIRLRVAGGPIGAAGYAEPRHLWVELRARRLGIDDGAGGTVAVLRDISALRQQEIDVAAARVSIETAIRSKDEFLANMSHELRTPLNSIIGFSEMLSSRTVRPADVEKQLEYARIVHQSGQHLLSVVNSILDMSKIQSGTFAIVPDPFDAVPLVTQCCDLVRLDAQQRGIEIVRDLPAALEEIVGDRRAAKQIVLNLLSNAIKFTPERGRVTVKARPDGNALRISVADTGIGIGDADLARLGDPFFQARSTLSRPFEGTGLGLSVVRGLVGLHGGTIGIESEPGKGTIVTVRLPLDCRVIASRCASATIETIGRRPGPEHGLPIKPFRSEYPHPSADQRMKQSA